eukprot:CCRYP_009184-RA/>CCRYP_009184-RA protein AED:0.26 eAED:0.26 QI:0/-1/0/1/-1/0/1/0/176
MIINLVNKTWFSRYPCCQYIIYDNGSEFKLHFKALCESNGIMSKPTSVKNPQANAILERVHQVISSMLRTAKIDMAPSVEPSNIDTFVTNVACAIHSTNHTVLKASPGAAIFGRVMLFDQVLLIKDGILRKGESRYESDPWTITTVHTNGTIRIQRGKKSERLNIRRVTPFCNNQT